jgi:hypothetical protein
VTTSALTPLSCSNCGATLTSAPEGNLLRCEYCRAEHLFLAPPPPRAANVRHTHSVGEAVMVEWGSRWWNAHILEDVGDAHWKIRYDGWSSRWDETVGEERIHPRGTEPEARAVGRVTGVLWLVTIVAIAGIIVWAVNRAGHSGPSSHGHASPSGQPITERTVIAVGERVEAYSVSSWYDARVLAVGADGRIRVHYEGWSTNWDEFVSRDRVRVFGSHAEGAVTVPGVALEANATLNGGDPVWGFSQGQWWRAEIVRPSEGGRYEVRYIGYEQRWNESLGVDRLRRRTE